MTTVATTSPPNDLLVDYLQRLNDDFVFFASELYRLMGLDQVAPIGWPEADIMEWIDYRPDKGGASQRGALAPRSIGKTTFGTCTYTCYRLFRDPETRIKVISKSRGKAREFIGQVNGWIKSENLPFLNHLAPPDSRTKKTGHTDNQDAFDCGCIVPTKDPSVSAFGIESQLEGGRADIVIADDVETRENTETFEARRKLADRVDEFTSISTFGYREVIWFGTYHHRESLYLKEAEKGVRFRTWPLMYPTSTEVQLNLAPKVQEKLDAGEAHAGDCVFEHRISADYIAERRARGQTYFAMQQQLNCDLGDSARYPLKLEDWIVFDCNIHKAPMTIAWGKAKAGQMSTCLDLPFYGLADDGLYGPITWDDRWEPYTGVKMWIDPAGRGEDKTAYAIIAHLNGYLWVLALEGLDGGFDDQTLTTLAVAARRFNVREIFIESNFGQDMLQALFEPVLARHFVRPGESEDIPNGWAATIETIRSTVQKEVRILDNLEPVMAQHRLVVDTTVATQSRLQNQISNITRQKGCLGEIGDDEIEALAECVGQWQYVLHQDPVKIAQRKKDAWLDDEIRKFQNPYRDVRGALAKRESRWFVHA